MQTTVDAEQRVTAKDGASLSAISIDNLSKIYFSPFHRLRTAIGRLPSSPVQALKNVSFDVSRGEIFGLLGKNGAGKTTLAKIIATLVQPTSGNARVYGHDSVTDEDSVKSLVGLATAEERSSYWRLSAEDNLLFFARIYGMSDKDARRRLAELMDQFDLGQYASRRFGELSTGNKQRVAIARSLLINPSVLLLDEPTRSMDPLAAAKTRKLISELVLQDPPVTVLLTSHNLSEVEELCDRVAVIDSGSIQAVGTPKSLCAVDGNNETSLIMVRETPDAHLLHELELECGTVHTEMTKGGARISFSRQSDDLLLDSAIRIIQANRVAITSVESSSLKLLDVLERLERESNGAGKG